MNTNSQQTKPMHDKEGTASDGAENMFPESTFRAYN